MFYKKNPTEMSGLDRAIDNVLFEMRGYTAESDEYTTMVDQLTKLYALKEHENPCRVSPDTLAIVVGNIIGIVLIVGHERAHIVTSKALNFVLKLR